MVRFDDPTKIIVLVMLVLGCYPRWYGDVSTTRGTKEKEKEEEETNTNTNIQSKPDQGNNDDDEK